MSFAKYFKCGKSIHSKTESIYFKLEILLRIRIKYLYLIRTKYKKKSFTQKDLNSGLSMCWAWRFLQWPYFDAIWDIHFATKGIISLFKYRYYKIALIAIMRRTTLSSFTVRRRLSECVSSMMETRGENNSNMEIIIFKMKNLSISVSNSDFFHNFV